MKKAGPNGQVSSSDKSTSWIPKTTSTKPATRSGTPTIIKAPGPRNA